MTHVLKFVADMYLVWIHVMARKKGFIKICDIRLGKQDAC